MKLKLIIPLTILSLLTICPVTAQKVTVGHNPIIYADVPDPDVIAVGDNFYMVSTTMFFCPGVPIMRSKDLVHWEIVNYVYDVLEDNDTYNLVGGKNAYGKGSWASSLRYFDGVFYNIFVSNDQHKTYIYKTKDIEKGPWTRSVIPEVLHDPSLLFEDGHLYVIYGAAQIRVRELLPDGSAIKKDGVDKVVIVSKGYNLNAEGSHLYKINGKYYDFVIAWPRGGMRQEICYRSDSLLGTYEMKVVMNDKIGSRSDGIAQGGIVQTSRGDWYSIIFQDHGAVGRCPVLQPVKWVDGWPVFGNEGKAMETVEVNLPPAGKDYITANDEFKYSQNKLSLVWQWNHNPDNSLWSVTERKGWLRLKTGVVGKDIMQTRNLLGQRTVGPRCSTEVLLDASGMQAGDHAGICAFQGNYAALGVNVSESGEKKIVLTSRVPRQEPAESFSQTIPKGKNKVYLKIVYNFEPVQKNSEGDIATFLFSFDGKTWTDTGYKLKMKYTLDLFVGYRSMIYNYATVKAGGYADFDYYRQSVL